MDDKEVRIDSGLGSSIHNDCTKRLQNGNMPYASGDKSYSDSNSHPLGKADTRPCAIIGPDRVLPPTNSSDVYMKTIPVDPWEYSENYRYPYDSIKMADYHQTRNISPRQTFQENMQRIMVPPTYSSIKNSDEPSLKNAKLNVPAEGKYCDVPYSINTLSSEHTSVRSDSVMAAINPSFPRGVPPHGWHPGGGMQPLKPYPAQDYYQNSEYSSCTGPRQMPIVQPQRIVHDELLPVYPDRLYQESNIRFKPYPTGKERFPQSRYEYVGTNTFQPPQIPLHKFDVQKPIHNHHYSMYPQGPYKYIDRRYPEPIMEPYPRPPHPQHNTYRNHPIQPSYGPLPSNFYQSKPYPCPSDNSKSMHINKLSYDANNKIYLELENSRSKGYPSPDNFFYNDRAKLMRGDILVPGHAPMNAMAQQHLYRKDNSPVKNYDHLSHYRHRDQHLNIANPLSRLPMQFSPNTIAISPCDSNTSNDTQLLGIPQEDCGYASQSSTTSVKSMDSNNSPGDYYKRQVHNYTSAIQNTSQRGNINSRQANSSDKKGLDVRQFLQMWNEGDEEDSENNKEVQNNPNCISSKSQASNNQEQLYVLGLVNVPNEELSKYEHLQRVSKLPENIKGYNNIEILNQFEQLVESPNMNNLHAKKPLLKEYKVSKSFTNHQTKEDLPRPVSPLDVEAKISQSVIHKEVGCNFEIKPCSPKVLNVDVATPVHDILGERLIEKVANPVLLGIERGNESKIVKPVDESMEVTSCKIKNSTYSPKSSVAVKPIYPLQGLDTNMGVCLASLPQLDNEIELNLPEVNQQFIDANKIEKPCSPHVNLPVLANTDQESTFMIHKASFQPNSDGHIASHLEPDKETIKLSKYRKTKKIDTVSYSPSSSVSQRTDSVIIKNPENIKIQNENHNAFAIENSVINNIIQSEINKPEISNNLFSSNNIVETAIDFSLNRSEHISHSKINTDNEYYISTSIEGSDFYKNNIDLSLSTGNNSQIKESEILYNSKNKKSDKLSPILVQDTKESLLVATPSESNNIKVNKDCIEIQNKADEESKSNNKVKDNLITIKDLLPDAPYYEHDSQISILTSLENIKKEKQPEKNCNDDIIEKNVYHNDEQSTKELQIDNCNHESILSDLTSEPIVTEHSDINIYSHFNNYSNNKINEINCPNTKFETKEATNLDNTSNTSDAAIDSTVLMACNKSISHCTDSFENINIQHVPLIEDKINGNKIKNVNLISENTMVTMCNKINNESLLSNEATNILSVKDNEDEIIRKSLITTKQSEINDLKYNIIQTTYCESSNEMLSSDMVTCDESSNEKNNATLNRDSLTISRDDVKNNDLIPENTIETPCSSSNNVVISSDLSTEYINEKDEKCDDRSLIRSNVNIQNSDTISDDTTEITSCKNNDETSLFKIPANTLSINERNDELNHKSAITSEENDSILNNTMESTCHKDNKEISLDLPPCIGTTQAKEEQFNEKDENTNFVSDNTIQKTCYENNKDLSLDVPADIVPTKENIDECNRKFLIVSNKCKENIDVKFDNTFEITCCENKNERLFSDNHVDVVSIIQDDHVLKRKFEDNVIERHSNGKNLNTSKSIYNKRRIHRKALFSPWIQKLILYNMSSYNENYNIPENERIKVFNLDQGEKTTLVEENSLEDKEKVDDFSAPKFDKLEDENSPQSSKECSYEVNAIPHELEENYDLCNNLTDIASPHKYSVKLCETDSRCFVSSESEQNKMRRCTSPLTLSKNNPKLLQRTSKRSLSDTAIQRYFEDEENDQPLLFSKKYKKHEEESVQSQMIATNLCNIIQTNRRNSISEIYNNGNVFILIDKDLIITEETEEQKICFTDEDSVTDNVEYNHEVVDTITENFSQDDKELWVDDVACIETIFSDDVAEDVEISTPSSPKDSTSPNYETVNNDSFLLCEEVIRNMENDVDIYERSICEENAYSIDTSSKFPKTKINKIFTCLESQNEEEIFAETITESNKKKHENIFNHLDTSDISFSNVIAESCTDNDDRILDDKENLEVDNNLIQESANDSFNKSRIDSQQNNVDEKFDDYNCALNPCNYLKYSSSPEVTSTTCEDKNPSILLKISSLKGSRVSHLENDKSVVKNKISYKLTEKKTYKHYNPNYNSSGTLITKAAQKYIPPLKITMSDLKVKLPLPKNSLDKLKQLKKSKVEPKIDRNSLKSNSKNTPREMKKQKPKFEDVLMSIDEFQCKKPKVKNKKVRNEIPKVVIKKNETGAHYTSSRCSNQDRHNPDLTGRKWQPWVFLEKNNFIDKMALKHKMKAIYCRRKNTYVLAEKFRKYKSVYNAKFVISQPKVDDLKKGNLKYTIRLKHN